MLTTQIDMRQQGPMIGRLANAGTVEDFARRDLRRGRRQHAVKRQEWPVDREGWLGRAAQIGAEKPLGQRKPAPRAPFVQIADKDGGLARFAEHILADRAQLRPTQGLHQRQVHADKAEFLAVVRQVRDDRTAMAASGQIKQGDAIDLNVRSQENDCAQKPMAAVRPAMCGGGVDVAQAGCGLDCCDVQQAAMRRDLFIRLLQVQRVDGTDGHFVQQGCQRSDGINLSVIAATAMNVPAQAGKVLISIGQNLAFAGSVMTRGQRNDSLNIKNIDMIGEINVCS